MEVEDEEWIVCKDCTTRFYVSIGERKWRQASGDGIPKRCEHCRRLHRERSWELARPNFPIANYKGGGCFEGLMADDIEDIDSWGTNGISTLSPESEPAIPKQKRRRKRFILWAPAWPNRMVAREIGAVRYPWHTIATNGSVKHPDVIRFRVADELVGAGWLRSTPRGLVLWWLEYGPQVPKYRNADLSLPFYAIAESIRQGRQGHILFRLTAHHHSLFERLGCQPTADSRLVELSATVAWRLILSHHGVSEPVIDELIRQNGRAVADIVWIVEQVGRGNLKPHHVEAFTLLARGVTWTDIKHLAIERRHMPSEEQTPLRSEIRDVLSIVQTKKIFEHAPYHAENRYIRYDNFSGQIVRFPHETSIQCLSYDPVQNSIVRAILSLQPHDEALVSSIIYPMNSYQNGTADAIYQLLDHASMATPFHILAVGRDFEQLPEVQRTLFVQHVAERGVYVFVLKHTRAEQMQEEVRKFLSRLDPPCGQSGDGATRSHPSNAP